MRILQIQVPLVNNASDDNPYQAPDKTYEISGHQTERSTEKPTKISTQRYKDKEAKLFHRYLILLFFEQNFRYPSALSQLP